MRPKKIALKSPSQPPTKTAKKVVTSAVLFSRGGSRVSIFCPRGVKSGNCSSCDASNSMPPSDVSSSTTFHFTWWSSRFCTHLNQGMVLIFPWLYQKSCRWMSDSRTSYIASVTISASANMFLSRKSNKKCI